MTGFKLWNVFASLTIYKFFFFSLCPLSVQLVRLIQLATAPTLVPCPSNNLTWLRLGCLWSPWSRWHSRHQHPRPRQPRQSQHSLSSPPRWRRACSTSHPLLLKPRPRWRPSPRSCLCHWARSRSGTRTFNVNCSTTLSSGNRDVWHGFCMVFSVFLRLIPAYMWHSLHDFLL